MVKIGWSVFYVVVLVRKSVTALGHNRDLNYYDGSRGRMDRNYFTHDEFFQRYNRPKRTPHSPNLWAKSSESQGVSCPTRLRENSLDTLGDSDRMKEVVHVPCPKRKSSSAKVVASFKGKSMKCNSEKSHEGNRGARELFRKNTRGNDLNNAVRQNAQWLILSSQDRIQKPNQGYVGPSNISTSKDQTGQNWNNMNQPLPNSYRAVPTVERPGMWRNPKGSKEDPRKAQYSKSAQYTPSAASHLKPNFQAPQSSANAPQILRSKDTLPLEKVGQPFSAAPNQGYYNLGPPKNSQVQFPNQGPYPKKDKPLQTPYEANRLLMNSYNITYDGPHHYGSQNQPSNNYNPVNPSGQLAYPNPNAQGQVNPSFFQSHVTPVNGIQYVTYTILYNATVLSETQKMFPSTNETRNGPWAPGALEVDIPPGYPHQPKLPTTRSFEAVNIGDLPKADQKIPGSNSQPSIPGYDIQGSQYQYQPFPNEKPHHESWRYRDGPYSNYLPQQNPSAAKQETQVSSYKPGITPSLEKTTQAHKGVFGKFKKEESKVKFIKPAKIPASNAHARMPPMDAQGPGGNTLSNAKPDESASLISQQKIRPKLQNSLAENEANYFYNEPKVPNPKAVIPLRKVYQDGSMFLNGKRHKEYQNISGDTAHLLNPPVTMDTSFYTNNAHKIASKFVSSEDVTYVPFRGVPQARNDEAFYDKNLNFLGKIERPPLVNIKKHKWTKLNRRFNIDRAYKRFRADYPVGLYSEPVDFHSDMSVEDFGTEHKPKPVDRHSRKCNHNRWPNPLRFNTHARTRA